MELPNQRKDLMTDLIELLHHIENIIEIKEATTVSQLSDFPDSRPVLCQEKNGNFKRFAEIVKDNDQIRSNESIQLAMRCLSILIRGPKTDENMTSNIELFGLYHNVALIVLAISNFLVMTLHEYAIDHTEIDDKKEAEVVLKHVHDQISNNEQLFLEIANMMSLRDAETISSQMDRMSSLGGQCGADMQKCTKKMQSVLANRQIRAEPTRIRKTSAWSLVSVGAATVVDSGETTVTTGDVAKHYDLKQEISRIHHSCQVFLENVDKLTKRFHNLDTTE